MRILQSNLKRTTDTFLFVSHTTNVLLLKFRCSIFIGVTLIKEMPGSVASETRCIFAAYNQQDAKFRNLFISVRRATCFRRGFLPTSGSHTCTYSVRYWSDKYLTLYVQVWDPEDGRKTHLKHVGRFTEINKLVKRCILLVIRCEYISDARTYEC